MQKRFITLICFIRLGSKSRCCLLLYNIFVTYYVYVSMPGTTCYILFTMSSSFIKMIVVWTFTEFGVEFLHRAFQPFLFALTSLVAKGKSRTRCFGKRITKLTQWVTLHVKMIIPTHTFVEYPTAATYHSSMFYMF